MTSKAPRPPADQDDEIDLFELVHFFVGLRRYWLIGGFGLGALALLYVLTAYPGVYSQMTENDIGLTDEKFGVLKQQIPALAVPLYPYLVEAGGEELARGLLDPKWIDEHILAVRGLEADKRAKPEERSGISHVAVTLGGEELSQSAERIALVNRLIRTGVPHQALGSMLNAERQAGTRALLAAEAAINQLALEKERGLIQLSDYKRLARDYPNVPGLQIMLDLNNNKAEAAPNNKAEAAPDGERFLPMATRIMAIEAGLSDNAEALRVAHQLRSAVELRRQLIATLEQTFSVMEMSLLNWDIRPLVAVLDSAKVSPQSLEGQAEIFDLQQKLLANKQLGERFMRALPVTEDKTGRGKVVVIAGVVGGFLGLLLGAASRLVAAYRRRYVS
jgi:hypothetical protein